VIRWKYLEEKHQGREELRAEAKTVIVALLPLPCVVAPFSETSEQSGYGRKGLRAGWTSRNVNIQGRTWGAPLECDTTLRGLLPFALYPSLLR